MPNTTDRAPARPQARPHLHVPSLARPLAVALALGLAAGCAQSEAPDPSAGAPGPTTADERYAEIPQYGNVLGSPTAPITLVDFSDLRCSHCRDFAEITLPIVIDRYVRTGEVRIVFENFPILGQPSVQAARMAVAAGLQNHMFDFVDAFYAREPVGDGALREVAASVPGLDVERALADKDSPEVINVLTEARQAAEHFSITGTPTLMLGKTGEHLDVLSGVSPKQPETLTGPIDDLLRGHEQR